LKDPSVDGRTILKKIEIPEVREGYELDQSGSG
jgi:hypothetical protein